MLNKIQKDNIRSLFYGMWTNCNVCYSCNYDGTQIHQKNWCSQQLGFVNILRIKSMDQFFCTIVFAPKATSAEKVVKKKRLLRTLIMFLILNKDIHMTKKCWLIWKSWHVYKNKIFFSSYVIFFSHNQNFYYRTYCHLLI